MAATWTKIEKSKQIQGQARGQVAHRLRRFLDLVLEADAEQGSHELTGELKYFYCVSASGFCAPKKVSVSVPIEIR